MYTATTTTLLASLLLAASSTLASPFPAPSVPRDSSNSITVTFIGAAGAQFTQPIPFTSTFTPVINDLSISHIATSGGPVACFGIDGSINKFPAAGYSDVGPPQTIVGCVAGPIPEGAKH